MCQCHLWPRSLQIIPIILRRSRLLMLSKQTSSNTACGSFSPYHCIPTSATAYFVLSGNTTNTSALLTSSFPLTPAPITLPLPLVPHKLQTIWRVGHYRVNRVLFHLRHFLDTVTADNHSVLLRIRVIFFSHISPSLPVSSLSRGPS
jgi:hypothetical protein